MKRGNRGLLLFLSALGALPGPLHAGDRRASPYRLSAEVLANEAYRATPVRSSATVTGDARPYAREIALAADAAGLDRELVHAVIAVESAYQASAVSEKGALGLMQLMPATALANGCAHTTEVATNLRAGTRYLKDLLSHFDNRLELALAAYNAGEAAVRRHGNEVPPYPETQRYVPAVLARYRGNSLAAAGARDPGKPPENYLPGTRLAPETRPARR